MATIRYRDDRCELAPGQTVLDALLERGYDIPNSCRNGVCQTCLMRAVEGTPPADSQKDLGPALRLRGLGVARRAHGAGSCASAWARCASSAGGSVA